MHYDDVHYDDKEEPLVGIVNPRLGFIRKVYSIISVQLLLTAGVTYASFSIDSFY